MRSGLTVILYFCFLAAKAQLPEEIPLPPVEVAVGNTSETTEYREDFSEESMQAWKHHPLDLNDATETDLSRLGLQPVQVNALMQYRNYCGSLVDIHELQAVPYFDTELIRNIMAYVTVGRPMFPEKTVSEIVESGNHRLMIFAGGPIPGSLRREQDYEGISSRLLAVYRFQYRNRIRIGLLGEKDAGEAFFRGRQRKGFDFYSGHLTLKGLGKLHTLVVGDYTVNIGQGLIQWQGISFGKSTNIGLLKRNSPALKPYQSSGEFNFYRGVGLTLQKADWQLTAFFSRRALDARLEVDSLGNEGITVSSIRTSGYHRNSGEWDGRFAFEKTTAGIVIRGGWRHLKWGFNTVHSFGSLPMKKDSGILAIPVSSIYKRYEWVSSLDWGLTRQNFHFFGEWAMDGKRNPALLTGMMVSLSAGAEAGFLFRTAGRGYSAEQGMAFSEYSGVGNETGFYTGITLRPFQGFQISASSDHFSNPWLRYRLSRPSSGQENLLEFRYAPSKKTQFHSRFRTASKAEDRLISGESMSLVEKVATIGWRWGLEHQPFPGWRMKLHAEINKVREPGKMSSKGQCLMLELRYQPMMSLFSATVRGTAYFVDDWKSRIYLLENNLLSGFSAPAMYGEGYRCQLLMKQKIGKYCKLGIGLTLSSTYDNQYFMNEEVSSLLAGALMVNWESGQ